MGLQGRELPRVPSLELALRIDVFHVVTLQRWHQDLLPLMIRNSAMTGGRGVDMSRRSGQQI